MLRSACAHPPIGPYTLPCAHGPAITSVVFFANTRNPCWVCASTRIHVFSQDLCALIVRSQHMQHGAGRKRCKEVVGRGNITCSGMHHMSWGRRHRFFLSFFLGFRRPNLITFFLSFFFPLSLSASHTHIRTKTHAHTLTPLFGISTPVWRRVVSGAWRLSA